MISPTNGNLPEPRSSAQLNNQILRLAAEEGLQQQSHVLRKNLITAVLSQMLPTNSYLKGGAALAIRYPLEEARNSRDIDSAYYGSREAFFQEFEQRLAEGWHGFTGEISFEERSSLPEGIQLEPLWVSLFYKGKRFAKISLEISPDISNYEHDLEDAIDPGMQRIFQDLGFTIPPLRMLSIEAQLAEKLNGLTSPRAARGRDLRDIEVIMKHHTPDLPKLREYARKSENHEGGHRTQVVVDHTPEDYEHTYNRAFGIDLDHAWKLAYILLKQVDENYQSEWVDTWEEVLAQEHMQVINQKEARDQSHRQSQKNI